MKGVNAERQEEIVMEIMRKEKQEINKAALICHAVLMLVLMLAYAVEVVKGARTLGYFVFFSIIALGPVAAEIILYRKNPANNMIQHILGYGFGVFYIFALFTATNVIAFTYVIPLLIVITLYSDPKYCLKISVTSFVVNLVHVVWYIFKNGFESSDITFYEIRVILMLLTAVYLCFSSRVLDRLNKLKMDDLNQEKEKISKLLDYVMGVSGSMSGGIVEMTEQIGVLGESVSETRTSMQEVSSGTNETAESVQTQLKQTEEIQRHIEEVDRVSHNISDSMSQAKQDIANGKSNLNTLLEHVESSEVAGREVVSDISSLEEYMKNMQSIIELITNVASQTSLLSLNASIEAARAGEAGRGFAVVAAEISSLANQTQGATVNITEVIQNVTERLNIAVKAVQQLMDNNTKQNEAAATAAQSFEKIEESSQVVDEQSRTLDHVVNNLAQSNSKIVESIQTISAISEEVSAHSSETYNISEKNASIVEQVMVIVNDLNDQAQKLNISTDQHAAGQA